MWGTLKPRTCQLPESTKTDYQHLYCGLCKGLGQGYSQASRVLVSHDAVFVGLLVEALSSDSSDRGRARCPMLPLVHRPILVPDSVPIRFAAAVQILLGDQWLADKAHEGKRGAALLRRFASGHVDRANTALADLGVSFEPVRAFEHDQLAVEKLGVGEVEAPARPTEHALAFVFETIASLPGIATSEADRARLASMGRDVGRLIYLTDALDDLEKDYLSRDYNPLLSIELGFVVIDPKRVERAASQVAAAIASLAHNVEALPLVRHRALVESVLANELPARARRAIAKARRAAASQRRAQLMRLRTASIARRAVHAVGVVAAFLIAWLFAQRQAFAQKPKQKAKALPSASVSASASASASSSSLPPLDIPDVKDKRATGGGAPDDDPSGTSSGSGGSGPSRTSPCNSGSGDCGCGNPCSDLCDSCSRACKSCCDGCGSSRECCDTCGKSCIGCCDGCKGCDGCCNGCNCNGCCR